ncbi:aldehyde dehydrogenase family protein [Ornithinimicrobium avium]|uniref:Aldehyde dehydrogenase n=1 Tax=Ornithinimicrobium avium TaxID=2283195 RepID=A0A345NIG1_9MICO|nr:aldehyde dehydrogenase family protein [Ornithinimicrobium avium]AXH94819.1 aldehyde dehydrogenase family protein [Ornithinimicrobium avium]
MTASPTDGQQGYAELVAGLRGTVSAGTTLDLAWRRAQLGALRRLVTENHDALTAAVSADVGKPDLEVHLTELSLVVQEIDTLLDGLEAWTAPRPVALPATYLPGTAQVQLQPKGVVLVIGPWNYPVQLLLAPVAGALAAGNTVVVKPSEVTPTVAALLAELLPRYLGADVAAVVTGGVPETTALLRERFDHVFFTGSGRVGRIVMKAAAEHLTPVTLELGGRSPAFVDGTVDIEAVARRIAWGKFTNAGQTCVAPDHVLVTREVREELLAALGRAITSFFGPDPRRSRDFGRIVNAEHHARLVSLLGSSGGRVVLGGQHDVEDRFYLAPTAVVDVPADADLLSEEIFGPVLPVVTVADAREAIEVVGAGERPLALYVFSEDEQTRAAFGARTVSGGLAYGSPLLHLTVPGLPFGGVGASGIGRYLGQASVEEFSHHRSVLSKPLRPDTLRLVYPPYPGWKRPLVRRLMAPLGRGALTTEVPSRALVAGARFARRLRRAG